MHDTLHPHLHPTDADLLRAYTHHGDPDAVRQLVTRYVDLVYAAATRQLRDPSLAEDVTQAVFILLVRKARTIDCPLLAGWLVNAARLVAKEVRRSESRRKRREQKAAAMTAETLQPAATPDQPLTTDEDRDALREHLDAALGRLNPADRAAISLRYLQGLNVPDVAASLGVSEPAAAKRLTRALAKLRTLLARSGFDRSALALDALLLQHARHPAAPPTLAARTTSAVLSTAAGPASSLATTALRASFLKTTATAFAAILATLLSLTILFYLTGPHTPAARPAHASLTPPVWQGPPIRVGYVISQYTADGPHWTGKPYTFKNQVREISQLRDPSVELFPLIEPGTADVPAVHAILGRSFPGRPVYSLNDPAQLRTLDVIVAQGALNALPESLAAVRAAVESGVGFLHCSGYGDITPGLDVSPDVPALNGLVRGQYGWNNKDVDVTVLSSHPLLGQLASQVGHTIRIKPNGPYGVLSPGAQGLLQVAHDDIYPVGNNDTVDDPAFTFYPLYVSHLGKGKIVGCSFAYYGPIPAPLQAATNGKFFLRCVRWLADRPLD